MIVNQISLQSVYIMSLQLADVIICNQNAAVM